MSDEQDTGTATIEGADSAVEADAPETAPPEPAPEPQGPLSKHEARRGLRDLGKGRKPTPAAEAAAPPEPEEEPEEEPTDAPPEPESEGTAETPTSEEPAQAEPEAEPEPAPTFPVEIPAEHPATRGKSVTIQASSEAEQNVLRALVNGTYTRNRDVENLRRDYQELERKLLAEQEKRIRLEAGQTARTKWEEMPEYQQAAEKWREIKEQYGDEAAKTFWDGASLKLQQLQEEEFKQQMGSVEQERKAREFQRWKNEAWARTDNLPAYIKQLPDFPQWFEAAVNSFNKEVELGQVRVLDPNAPGGARKPENIEDVHLAFAQFFKSRVVNEPAVQRVVREMRQQQQQQTSAKTAEAKQREREAIERAAVKKAAKEAADRRKARPPHPLGPANGASRDRVPQDADQPTEQPVVQSALETRKAQRRGAREDARKIVRGR